MIKTLIEKEIARQLLRWTAMGLIAVGTPTELAQVVTDASAQAWVAGMIGWGVAEVSWLISKKFKKG